MKNSALGRRCHLRQASCSLRPRASRTVTVSALIDSGPSTSAPAQPTYNIRRGTVHDVRSLAHVCAEGFGRGNFPGLESEALDQLEARYAVVIAEDMEPKLRDALTAKEQAQREHREHRLQRHLQRLRAQLAALRGEPARFPTQVTPQEERAVQRWLRTRQFMILTAVESDPAEDSKAEDMAAAAVAAAAGPVTGAAAAMGGNTTAAPGNGLGSEAVDAHNHVGAQGTGDTGAPPTGSPLGCNGDGTAGRVVGCATLSLMQPEALLPPPFPSNKPFRLYVSNMSVLPSQRRRGLARRLLQQCERVARMWGHSSLWLHVKRQNDTAARLYRSMGYTPVHEGGLSLLPGPLSQVLMRKDLSPLQHGCPVALRHEVVAGGDRAAAGHEGPGSVVEGVTGAVQKGNGVFVWNAVVEDRPR
ncbi:hypothetical protein Agub_g9112 [Astrephomene gubernaculifera]|uniref:N-acetyltransferase domain-containing protein n=1 Tax=Astrephomene gubernaculifera TaxID=47775 RepID=A0AAD3DST7_9CHLO|nr:hypothetical protein Agub_g9112 [Astrephomene gubernaculifera]